MSCSSSVLVRSSTATEPRPDSSELPCDLISSARSRGLGVVDLQVLGAQRLELLDLLRAASRPSRGSAISSAGATMMTSPFSRMSRPLVRSTMSSAWSQGTFCRRSVTLP